MEQGWEVMGGGGGGHSFLEQLNRYVTLTDVQM